MSGLSFWWAGLRLLQLGCICRRQRLACAAVQDSNRVRLCDARAKQKPGACGLGLSFWWVGLRLLIFSAPVAAGLQKSERCPCSSSAVSAAGSASLAQQYRTRTGRVCYVQAKRKPRSEPFPQKRTQNKRKKPNKNAEIKSAAIRRRKRQVQLQNLQVNASRGQNGGGWCCKRLRDRQRHRPVQLPL